MRRHNEPEAMDAPNLDAALLAGDLENLATLNRFFGGRSVIRRRLPTLLAQLPPDETMTVLDVGSGAGDLCREIVGQCRRVKRPVRLWSVDYHPQVQAFAVDQLRDLPEVRFLRADARALPLRDESVLLTLCTLALHHFSDPDARRVLAELRRVSQRWCLVSDLRRGPMALAAVWAATRFSTNSMTRKDGPLSVRRAFTAREMGEAAAEAGWYNALTLPEPWFRMSLLLEKRPE